MLDRSTGAHLRYIPVASSSNPYDVVQEGDYLYVSGLFTNKVYKISLQSYSVVANLDVGVSPRASVSPRVSCLSAIRVDTRTTMPIAQYRLSTCQALAW